MWCDLDESSGMEIAEIIGSETTPDDIRRTRAREQKPRLDDDVLLVVLSYADRRTLVALSQTERWLGNQASTRLWHTLTLNREVRGRSRTTLGRAVHTLTCFDGVPCVQTGLGERAEVQRISS